MRSKEPLQCCRNKALTYALLRRAARFKVSDEGLGTKQDFQKAFYWYEKAAVQGDASAAYNLGNIYRDGRVVLKNEAKWAQAMQTSAKLGNPAAQFNVALMYTTGEYVAKDLSKAFEWLDKAAEGGDLMARVNTAIALATGSGVKVNLPGA
jgi:TPR repeat protein